MKSCPKCGNDHDKPGIFCSRGCANSRTWSDADKLKKSESAKNSEKVKSASERVKGAGNDHLLRARAKKRNLEHIVLKGTIRVCEVCFKEFEPTRRTSKLCSMQCLGILNKVRCSTEEEKIRLRDIGRKGGFGKKGYTANGTYYQSSFEKKCFEFLESNNIAFEAHKPIPNSSKISDIYLIENDIWIELDGINREKTKKWIGKHYEYWITKLEIYRNLGLNFFVITSFNDFKLLIDEY